MWIVYLYLQPYIPPFRPFQDPNAKLVTRLMRFKKMVYHAQIGQKFGYLGRNATISGTKYGSNRCFGQKYLRRLIQDNTSRKKEI